MSGKRGAKGNRDSDDKIRKRIEDLKNEIKKVTADIEKEKSEGERIERLCTEEADKTRILLAEKKKVQEQSHLKKQERDEKNSREIEHLKLEITSIIERQKRVKVETINIKNKVMMANCDLVGVELSAKEQIKKLELIKKRESELMLAELRELETFESKEIELVKRIASFIPGAPKVEREVIQPQDFTLSATAEEEIDSLNLQIAGGEQYKMKLTKQIAEWQSEIDKRKTRHSRGTGV